MLYNQADWGNANFECSLRLHSSRQRPEVHIIYELISLRNVGYMTNASTLVK